MALAVLSEDFDCLLHLITGENPTEKIAPFVGNVYFFNEWNIRRLVDESFVPSAQQTSILYCRLTDFRPTQYLPFTTILFHSPESSDFGE